MSLMPTGIPCRDPRNCLFPASASHLAASASTALRSRVTHAWRRESSRSIRANSEFTYSTGDRTPSRMAAAASITDKSSGFIFDFHQSCAQLLQLRGHLLHFGLKFGRPLFAKLFFGAEPESTR